MIYRVLGLNEEVLRQCSATEQAAYRLASRLFLFSMLIAVVGNASFGWLLLRSISGVLVLSILMSFIHFSVLRISLITLMTRPLTEEVPHHQNDAVRRGKFLFVLFQHPLFKPVSLLRFVFAACIAVSVSMPLTSMLFYRESMQAEQVYRDAFLQRNSSSIEADSALMEDFMQAHYPFVIFRKLMQKPGCLVTFLLFCGSFFAPLILLSRLRHAPHAQYTHLLKKRMLQEVLIDYDETLEQMQHELNRTYPEHQICLKDLSAFADGPLRNQLKRDSRISFGDKKAFDDFLNSI